MINLLYLISLVLLLVVIFWQNRQIKRLDDICDLKGNIIDNWEDAYDALIKKYQKRKRLPNGRFTK